MRFALLVLVACGGSPPPPPAHTGGAAPPPPPTGVTCGEVAVHLVAIAPAPDVHDELVELLRDRCTADAWNAEARTCFQRIPAKPEAFGDCRGQLSAIQASALAAAIDALASRPITVQLPKGPPPTPHPSIAVALALDGTITVAGAKVSVAELDKALAAAAQADPDTQVIFQADAKTSVKDVNEIVTRVKAAGLKNIAFAVAP